MADADQPNLTSPAPVQPHPAPATPPARIPSAHWDWRHSAGVVGTVVFFIWMAFLRPWGLLVSWIVAMAGLTVFMLIVASGVTGTWKGAFVDDRLRMSLARLQLIVWTIVIVAAFGTMAIARAQKDPVTAMDIAVPDTIWVLLGISTTSFIGSPLIKNAKKETPTDDTKAQSLVAAQTGSASNVTWEGKVVKNLSIRQASLADLFMGDYVDNFALLDVGKIQMFFFTVLLVLSYVTAIGAQMTAGLLSSLPTVGAGMLPLLGISHAGYLMSKVSETSASDKK